MKLAELDDAARKKYGISEDVEGVVITEVKPGTARRPNGASRPAT